MKVQMKQTFAMFIFALAVHATPVSSSTGYHIIKKIPVPGDGRFDYLTVDDAAPRLYVLHGTKVDVIDI
jgi:hypothetical protein